MAYNILITGANRGLGLALTEQLLERGHQVFAFRRHESSRLAELQAMQQEIQASRNQRLVGTVVEVLVDGASKQGRGQLKGRTRSNRVVNFEGSEEWPPLFLASSTKLTGTFSAVCTATRNGLPSRVPTPPPSLSASSASSRSP